jgi:LPXTG-motif cell wall-anchored protein
VRWQRMMSLLTALFAATAIAPVAAHAVPYPADPPPAEVSDGIIEPGGTVTFSGSGFLPFEKITIDLDYGFTDSEAAARREPAGGFVLAAAHAMLAAITTTADANGDFSVEVPLTEPGTVTLMATGVTSGVSVSSTVEVLPTDGGDDGGEDGGGGGGDDGDSDDDVTLPTTGPSGTPLLIAAVTGGSAVVLGALALWLTRSRRRAAL